MKTHASLVTLLTLGISSLVCAAEVQPGTGQLKVFSKNLARQHLGSNLFLFNSANQTYVPTEAAAAWLDDDATTGWPVMAGKQSYLLVLSEPEVLANFSVSARPATGTISLYAGDEPTAPGSSSWKPLAKNVSFESVNNKKLAKSFNHFAKYLLIQTDIADPGPVYGLHVFGDKPAVSYSLRKREQRIDARAIFGQFVNNQTDFSLTSLSSGARVTSSNSAGGSMAWQRAIDDNPETSLTLSGSGNESSAVISLGTPHMVSRVTFLTDPGAKGKVDVYAMRAPSAPGSTAAVPLDTATPTVSIVLDGTNARSSIDFPSVEASQVALRWIPENPTDKLALREVAAFNGITLDEYEVGLSPEAVAEYSPTGESANEAPNTAPGGDGKDYKDPKKGGPEPVALGPGSSPYLPGALGFPPTLLRNIQPVSP